MAIADPEDFMPPPILCSMGGIPYNDYHLKKRDAEIASLRRQLAAVPPSPAPMSDGEMMKLLGPPNYEYRDGRGALWDSKRILAAMRSIQSRYTVGE